MHRQAATLHPRHSLRFGYSRVFNDLSRGLFQRALSNSTELLGVAQEHGDRGKLNVAASGQTKLSPKNGGGNENIIVGDLAATLEAHRASNRAKIIRKINRPPPVYQDWKRLVRDEETSTVSSCGTRASNGSATAILAKKTDGAETQKETELSIEATADKPTSGASSRSKQRPIVRRTKGEQRSLVRRPSYTSDVKNVPDRKQSVLGNEGTEGYVQSRSEDKCTDTPKWVARRPWLAYVGSVHEDRLDRLSSEIAALNAYMSLTPAEEEAARLIGCDVKSALGGEFAPEEIQMVGSRSTGLANTSSDFDFNILPKKYAEMLLTGKTNTERRKSGQVFRKRVDDVLKRVVTTLRTSPNFNTHKIKRIYGRINLVRAVHHSTGAQIEIQTMTPFQASQEQTKVYMREFPSLRPLFITMQTCLRSYGFTTVFDGGIGSYTLTLMIVTALNHAKGNHDPEDLGGQLLHILKFWSSADLYRYAFSANPPLVYENQYQQQQGLLEGGAASKPQSSDSQLEDMNEIGKCHYNRRSYLLCLQDPADYLNDLGAKSSAIKNVQITLNYLHERMTNFIRRGDNSIIKDRDERFHEQENHLSVLYDLIKADFHDLERSRSRLEHYADPKMREAIPLRGRGSDENVVSFEQQVRAIEYRKRHGLQPLITEPHSLVDAWHFALGFYRCDPADMSMTKAIGATREAKRGVISPAGQWTGRHLARRQISKPKKSATSMPRYGSSPEEVSEVLEPDDTSIRPGLIQRNGQSGKTETESPRERRERKRRNSGKAKRTDPEVGMKSIRKVAIEHKTNISTRDDMRIIRLATQ